MATIRYSMRQKKWIVTWKVRGATFHHECASEESALSFSEIQRTISQKEKERFTQTKPIRKSITIRELFDHHFSLCSKRPITIKQDLYHARPLLQSLGTKQVASITQKEILAFCKSQKASGLAQFLCCVQSQVGEKEKGIYLQPLRIAPFQKGKPEELPRRPSRNSMHSCASLSRMSSASSYSAFIRVPASARVNSFP